MRRWRGPTCRRWLPGFADAGWMEHQLGGRAHLRQHPFAIRGKEAEASITEAHCGGAISFAHVDTVVRPHGFAGFREDDGLAVGRHVCDEGPIEPRETAFMRLAGRKSVNADARFIGSEKNEAGAADVMNRQAARRTVDQPFFAGEIEGVDRARRSSGDGGEPSYLAVGAPRDALHAGIKRGTRLAISVGVGDDDTTVVAGGNVVGKCQVLAGVGMKRT